LVFGDRLSPVIIVGGDALGHALFVTLRLALLLSLPSPYCGAQARTLLCNAHTSYAALAGFEIALKGL